MFFRSTDARKDSSKARALIESARHWNKEMPEQNFARVLYAAIILGGSTLTLYINSVMELDQSR